MVFVMAACGAVIFIGMGVLIVGLCQTMADPDDASLREWEQRQRALRKSSETP